MAILTRLLNPNTTTAMAPAYRRSLNMSLADLDRLMDEAVGAGRSAAGRDVSANAALSMAAVWACVRILSETVGSLPLVVYERLANGGKERALRHPLYAVLHERPNPEMTSMELREALMGHLALWGNAYCEIQRSPATGDVLALWPLRPDKMAVTRGAGGQLSYVYTLADGGKRVWAPDRIMHLRGLSANGIGGYSVLSIAREAIGLGLAAEEFGARFFGNGAVPGLVLQHPGTLGDEAHKRLRDSWNEAHQGLQNAQRVAILEEGLTVEKVGIPPEDAQFLETRKFQVTEIARIFGVPPHMIGDLDRATFSNIEQQSIDFVTRTVRPWTGRIEQRMTASLVAPVEQPRYFVEHILEGLLRGDIASRYQAYAIGRQWGWLSANDVRRIENMNPVDEGDAYLTPLNMIAAGEEPPAPEEAGQRATAPVIEVRAADNAAAGRHRLQGTYRPVLANSAQRIINREVNDIKNGLGKLLRQRLEAELRADIGDGSEFDQWINGYYEAHQQFITDYLAPVVNTYADLVVERVEAELGREAPVENLRRFAAGVLASLASVWVGESKSRIRKALAERQGEDPQTVVQEVLEEMQANRADDFAQDASVRVNNAVAVEAYSSMGVLRKTWVSFGENCPYCDELNGRSIEIGLAFLPADGVLAPVGHAIFRSGAHIGHAPLHQGCDCMVMAG